MVGLAEVPEPLWWLLGAIVGFYFGARELHYRRVPRAVATGPVRGVLRRLRGSGAQSDDTNSALTDWAGGGRNRPLSRRCVPCQRPSFPIAMPPYCPDILARLRV
jgi:hypothetical protein